MLQRRISISAVFLAVVMLAGNARAGNFVISYSQYVEVQQRVVGSNLPGGEIEGSPIAFSEFFRDMLVDPDFSNRPFVYGDEHDEVIVLEGASIHKTIHLPCKHSKQMAFDPAGSALYVACSGDYLIDKARFVRIDLAKLEVTDSVELPDIADEIPSIAVTKNRVVVGVRTDDIEEPYLLRYWNLSAGNWEATTTSLPMEPDRLFSHPGVIERVYAIGANKVSTVRFPLNVPVRSTIDLMTDDFDFTRGTFIAGGAVLLVNNVALGQPDYAGVAFSTSGPTTSLLCKMPRSTFAGGFFTPDPLHLLWAYRIGSGPEGTTEISHFQVVGGEEECLGGVSETWTSPNPDWHNLVVTR